MSETPINLNKVRKARARAADKSQAQANAVAFGRTKAEKLAQRAAQDRTEKTLDGKVVALRKGSDPDET